MKAIVRLLLVLLCLPVSVSIAGQLEPFREVPIPADNQQTVAKAALGKKLFFDRRLSGDGTMSCATCHEPDRSFSDGLEVSLNYPTTRNWRNSPTLVNVGLQDSLFHDGRAATLEEQALFPMMSAFEMNQNLDYLEEEIRAVPEYVAEFREVFGDNDVTRLRIAQAIAAFERTIVSGDSPLDRFLKGEQNGLSGKALQGYRLFTGKAGCVACHYGANLTDGKFHALMVAENPDLNTDARVAATRRFVAKIYEFPEYRTLAEDPGRYLITKDRRDWKAFKTPTLREIGETEPYMHNGIYSSLMDVIEFFAGGGGPDNSVLKPLNLSAVEKEQLLLFLEEGLSSPPHDFTYPKIPSGQP